MYTHLNNIKLKSGETVEACVITGPDLEWRERVQQLLLHKGDPWDWQNTELLANKVGVQAYFYLLHRDGVLFSNIMTVELNGVGLFGHVWTNPDDREKGAASQLMDEQMHHFRARGGRALYLSTAFASHAFHMYRKRGFEPIEPGSGNMSYFVQTKQEFEADYFAPGRAEISPLDWPHWPTAAALFTGDFPGVVRCAPLGLIGRKVTEGPLLPVIREHRQQQHLQQGGSTPRAWALHKPHNGAVVGLCAVGPDPLWPNTNCLDIYCHPDFWNHAEELLSKIAFPKQERVIAYADSLCPQKQAVLRAAGFKAVATIPRWIAADLICAKFADAVLYENS